MILALVLVPVMGRAALLVGVDLTLQPFEVSSIVSSVMRWIDQNAEDGETVQVIAVTAMTLTAPKVLAEATLPASAGIMGTDRTKSLDAFKGALQLHLKEQRSPRILEQSRIADFFLYAASAFPQTGSKGKIRKMVLYSDMLEVHDGVNWETGPITSESIKIPRLSGSIEIRGVQSAKFKNSEMWEQVRDAWTKALSDAGVKVRVYSSAY